MDKPATQTTIDVLKAVKKYGPIASPDLAAKMGKKVGTIDFYMRVLHRAKPKQVYVAEVRDTDGRGRNARLWAAGDLPDATRSEAGQESPLTEDELEEKWISEDRKRRAALAANRVQRDPFIAQFFGAPA